MAAPALALPGRVSLELLSMCAQPLCSVGAGPLAAFHGFQPDLQHDCARGLVHKRPGMHAWSRMHAHGLRKQDPETGSLRNTARTSDGALRCCTPTPAAHFFGMLEASKTCLYEHQSHDGNVLSMQAPHLGHACEGLPVEDTVYATAEAATRTSRRCKLSSSARLKSVMRPVPVRASPSTSARLGLPGRAPLGLIRPCPAS